jgi:hypothetical protein
MAVSSWVPAPKMVISGIVVGRKHPAYVMNAAF